MPKPIHPAEIESVEVTAERGPDELSELYACSGCTYIECRCLDDPCPSGVATPEGTGLDGIPWDIERGQLLNFPPDDCE